MLRTQKLGEADRIATLLTRANGKVRAVAKGVRRTSSRFGARLEPFSYVDLQLATGRTLDVITQAESISAYGEGIVNDYARYTAGTVLLETADRLVVEEKEPATQHHLLLAGALRVLSTGEREPALVLDSFLLALTGDLRLRPVLRRLRPLRRTRPPPRLQPRRRRHGLRHLPPTRLSHALPRHRHPPGRPPHRRLAHRPPSRPPNPPRIHRPDSRLLHLPPRKPTPLPTPPRPNAPSKPTQLYRSDPFTGRAQADFESALPRVSQEPSRAGPAVWLDARGGAPNAERSRGPPQRLPTSPGMNDPTLPHHSLRPSVSQARR